MILWVGGFVAAWPVSIGIVLPDRAVPVVWLRGEFPALRADESPIITVVRGLLRCSEGARRACNAFAVGWLGCGARVVDGKRVEREVPDATQMAS